MYFKLSCQVIGALHFYFWQFWPGLFFSSFKQMRAILACPGNDSELTCVTGTELMSFPSRLLLQTQEESTRYTTLLHNRKIEPRTWMSCYNIKGKKAKLHVVTLIAPRVKYSPQIFNLTCDKRLQQEVAEYHCSPNLLHTCSSSQIFSN